MPDFEQVLSTESMQRHFADERLWQVLLVASKSVSAVERAISSGEPAHVAKYAFQLAQTFNNLYHDYPVISEEDPERRAALLWLTTYVRDALATTSKVLGIPKPPYM